MLERLRAAYAAFKNPRLVDEGKELAGAVEGLALRSDIAILEPRMVDGEPYAHIIQLPYDVQQAIRRFLWG